MARGKSDALDGLLELATRLPWHVSLVLAPLSFVAFHILSMVPMPALGPVAPGQLGQALPTMVFSAAAMAIGTIFQYILPLVFLIGAGVSYFRQRNRADLFDRFAMDPQQQALDQMSWREFEKLVGEVFRRKGFQVIERGGDGPDGGVDLELRLGTDRYFVQCKQWKARRVGVAIVRELFGVMSAEGAVGGFVVTSGVFTEQAKRFAEGRSIELVPASALVGMLESSGGDTAARQSRPSAPACPNCGSGMVLRTAKHGPMKGSEFWGCSNYPNCRGIRQVS